MTGVMPVQPHGEHTGAATSITAGLTTRTLSDTTGTETHTLVTAEIPAHLHGATSQAATTGYDTVASVLVIEALVTNHDHALAHTHTTPATDEPSNSSTSAGTSHNHANGTGSEAFKWLMRKLDSGAGTVAVDNVTVGEPQQQVVGEIQAESAHTHPMPHTHAAMTTDSQSVSTTTSTTNPSIAFTGASGSGSPSVTSTVTPGGHTHTIATTNTGGGGAHNNLSPIIAVNYIIKV